MYDVAPRVHTQEAELVSNCSYRVDVDQNRRLNEFGSSDVTQMVTRKGRRAEHFLAWKIEQKHTALQATTDLRIDRPAACDDSIFIWRDGREASHSFHTLVPFS